MEINKILGISLIVASYIMVLVCLIIYANEPLKQLVGAFIWTFNAGLGIIIYKRMIKW